jgi:WD40 repeat protein
VAFDPRGDSLVTGSLDATAQVWDLRGTAKPIILSARHPVLAVAFSPDGNRIALAERDNGVLVYDAAGSGPPLRLSDPSGQVDAGIDDDQTFYSVAFAPDGQSLAAASADSKIRIFDLNVPGRMQALIGHEGPVWSVAFDPLGDRLLSASSDKTVRVWDLTDSTGQRFLSFSGHDGAVDAVALGSRGRLIATGSWDNTARIWCAAPSVGCGWNFALRGHGDRVRSVAFSPSGDRVVTGSDDGTARVWNLVSPDDIRGALWAATSECLQPGRREAILGETQDEAAKKYDWCLNEIQRRRGWK